ncbi:hypothetical protein LCGC14_2443540, partial [marine sediment metagenome]
RQRFDEFRRVLDSSYASEKSMDEKNNVASGSGQ